MKEKELRNLLLAHPLPDEHLAEERTWDTVRAAFLSRERLPRERRVPRKTLLLLALVGAGVAIGFSSVGGSIGDWVRDTLGRETTIEVPVVPTPELLQIPGGGQLLVSAPSGVWSVAADGTRRKLGEFDGATWAPSGRFVAAWRAGELSAIDPDAADPVRWSVPAAADLRGARWSPDGLRVAYVAGESLRVVAGDGTGDRELVATAAQALPAWRPGAEHELAFADPAGRLVVVDADTGERAWQTARAPVPSSVEWADDGEHLLVASEHRLAVFAAPRRLTAALRVPPARGSIVTAAFQPGTLEVAYAVYRDAVDQTQVLVWGGRGPRLLLTVPGRVEQLRFSPDGTLVLLAWAAGDQWLFLPLEAGGRVEARSGVAREFAEGDAPDPAFPRVDGWCCTAAFSEAASDALE